MKKKNYQKIMLSQQIKNKIVTSKYFLEFVKNQKVGLAVSGGVDSMLLLDIFTKISKSFNLKLFVMHYNHKWRKESYLDAELVKQYCKKHNLQFLYKESKGRILKDEAIAREQRYSFFKASANKEKFNIICTAHHEDDQVETILFRLSRGTGPNGLFPIKEFSDFSKNIKIYRPLLGFTKEQIYKYAKKIKLPYLEDKTNDDIKYKRNLIRKEIIPLLKKINENAVNNILLCSDLIYSQNIIVNAYLSNIMTKVSCNKRNSFLFPLKISRSKMLQYDEHVCKSFIYRVLTANDLPGNVSKIKLVLNAIKNKTSVELSKEYVLSVEKSTISFDSKKSRVVDQASDLKLNKQFVVNGRLKTVLIDEQSCFELKPFVGNFSKKVFPKDNDKFAYVDLSLFKNKKLALRSRKPKDVFQPLGYSKEIKLKNYLINKKILKQYRYKLPLLCFNNEVLWIPGYSLSDKLKVTNKPTHVLKVINCGT